MAGDTWSRREVEAICDDYLSMLSCELSHVPYNKAAHLQRLLPRLNARSRGSIEFKHANISAALIDLRFPTLDGYKPRGNYQALLLEVLAEKLDGALALHQLAASDVERPIVVPEVDDILAALTAVPERRESPESPAREAREPGQRLYHTDYLEREARNRSLGDAGEQFAFNYEQARLIAEGKEDLAAKVEHTSKIKGDGAGYDILSFDASGKERLVEVKTTKYRGLSEILCARRLGHRRLDRWMATMTGSL